MSGTYVKLPVTTTDPVGPAGGDLSGTYPNPTVATVGGSTAANIHTAQLAVAAATNANTASTIVKRNASGSFTAGDCTFGKLTATGDMDVGGQFSVGQLALPTYGLVADDQGLYYPASGASTFVDTSQNIYYPNGAVLVDNGANLNYSTGNILADSNGSLFYPDGNNITDAQENLYSQGNLNLPTTGKGIALKEGLNARMGTAVLNGITAVVVSNTTVTANTRIFLTINTAAGTPGSPYVSARVASTSFSIKSTGAADTSTVAYLLIEPL